MPLSRKILIADHHTDRLPALDDALRARGLTVFHSSHLPRTLEAVARRCPDLVVLAPLAQDPSGYEITQVRSLLNSPTQRLLVVLDAMPPPPALTADTTPEPASDAASRPSSDPPVLDGPCFDDFHCRSPRADELLARILLCLRHADQLRELLASRDDLARETITDFKTGLYNDRFFHKRLNEEFRRAQRHGFMLSCMLLDFDNFKQINDNFDHPFGDFVLLAFAKKLRSIIRDIDIPARIGGDEFAILLPNTGLDHAVRIADRLRRILANVRFENRGHATTVTLSIGVDSVIPASNATPADLLHRADVALLEAKRRGRNRICLYQELTGELSRGT